MGKRNNRAICRILLTLGVLAAVLVVDRSAANAATTYVWQPLSAGDASGSWDLGTNWSPSGPFTGNDNTADFNTQNITVDSIVTLDADQTIGTIKFGDTTTSSAASWTINSGTAGKLILGVTSGAPVITVNALGTSKFATINAVVDGTQGFTKNGSGSLLLTNASNSYTGTTTISAGILRFSSLGALGAGGAISINGGTLLWESGNTADISTRTVTIGSSGATLNTNVAANNVVLNNSIGNGGNGALTKSGSGTLTLNAAAGWTGATNVNGGTLAISNVNQVSAGTLSFGGGGMTLTGTLNFANTVTFASNTTFGGTSDVTFNGNFTNSGANRELTNNITSLTLAGNVYLSEASGTGRTLVLRGNATSNTTISGAIANRNGAGLAGGLTVNTSNGGIVALSSNSNSFTGLTTVTNGTLKIISSNGTALASSSGVSMATATTAKLDLAGTSQSITALSGGSGVNGGSVTNSVAATTSTLTITGNAGSYAGNIQNGSGTMALVKSGTGTQILTGANTYSGGTSITGGRLTVNTGGRLGLGATVSVTVGVLGVLELNTGTAIDDAATLSIDLAASPNVVLGTGVSEIVGTLIIDGSMFTSGTFGATGSGATTIRDDVFSGSGVVSVPEPAGLSLLALGAAALLRRRRGR